MCFPNGSRFARVQVEHAMTAGELCKPLAGVQLSLPPLWLPGGDAALSGRVSAFVQSVF